jgi:hypothetical protein
MRAPFVVCLVAALGACNKGPSQCEEICHELVYTCQFAAYPDFGSCVQGCDYNEGEGADVAAQHECVERAECDPFAIVECENQHGAG